MTTPYTTGTVTLTNNSTAVTGTGTGWQTALITGGVLYPAAAGNPLPIADIVDNTHLTAAIPWRGTTGTYSYAIVRDTDYGAQQVANANALTALLDQLQDPALSALASLTPAADRVPYFNGTQTAVLAPLLAKGRDIIGANTMTDLLAKLGPTFGGPAPEPAAAGVGLADGDLDTINVPGVYTIAGTYTNGPNTLAAQTLTGVLEVKARIYSNGFWQYYTQGSATWRRFTTTSGGLTGWQPWILVESTNAPDKQNLIINGDGYINQRNLSSFGDGAYGPDRHYALTQSGPIGYASASASGTLAPPMPNGARWFLRLTQTLATAQRFGVAQILERKDVINLRGQTVTLGGWLKSSLDAWGIRFAVLAWTGTADAVTQDVVNDWASTNFTPGGFFIGSNIAVVATGTVNTAGVTVVPWKLIGTIPTSANNIIVLYWTNAAWAQNETLDMLWYLVTGDQRSGDYIPFNPRPLAEEFAICQRYYEENRAYTKFDGGLGAPGGISAGVGANFMAKKRIDSPTVSILGSLGSNFGSLVLQGVSNSHAEFNFAWLSSETIAARSIRVGFGVDAEIGV